jgi:hypothetical protein
LDTAVANARKAKADAAKAEQDAYSSLVSAAATRGTDTVNTGAGVIESTSVGSDALAAIGNDLLPQIRLAYNNTQARVPDDKIPPYCDAAGRRSRSIILVSDPWRPDTAGIDTVYPELVGRIKSASNAHDRGMTVEALIKGRLDAADGKLKKQNVKASRAGGFAPALLLAGISGLASAFKTDIDFYGVTVGGGDSLLLRTLAGQVHSNIPEAPVYLPAVVAPSRGAGKKVLANFIDLDTKLSVLAQDQADLNALATAATAGQAAAGDKTPLGLEYAQIGKDLGLLRAPLDAFLAAQQTWITTMFDQSKGQSPAQQAATQADIGCIIADGGLIAQIKAEAFGGSVYTKKTLFTAFGKAPIFVSAGSVVSFTFLDEQSLDFVNSGVVKSMGQWTRITDAGPRGTVANVNYVPIPPSANSAGSSNTRSHR